MITRYQGQDVCFRFRYHTLQKLFHNRCCELNIYTYTYNQVVISKFINIQVISDYQNPKTAAMPPRCTQFSSSAVIASQILDNVQIEGDYIPEYDGHTIESSRNTASSPTPSQQLLHGEDNLPGLTFDIDWDGIRFSNGELVTKTGKLGYCIVHRRQHGGRGKTSNIWQFGANLSYTAPGQRPKPYWLCKECHLTNRNPKSQLYVASGHASISNHLLCKHSIDEDRKQILHRAATMKRYQSYLEEPIPLVKVGNPLKFWIQMSKDPSYRYPKLAKLGIHVQSAPAMSSECERVFSEAKRLITDDRNLLSEVTIQAIQCQKNWLDNGLVHSELANAITAEK